MRAYECIYILEPSLDEQAVKDKTAKYSEIITSRRGQITNVDQWGKRKLAYPIRKLYEGQYTFIRFSGDSEILTELGRVFRFDDAVLRHLIVVEEHPKARWAKHAPAAGK
jgi:small subunit ribosomal protein S6